MGYNTVAVILNDALGQIENDPEVGKGISDAVRSWYGRDRDPMALDVMAGNHCNAMQIISQDHADDEQVVIVSRNSGCRADEATGLGWQALGAMQRCLERHGYNVTKPRKTKAALSSPAPTEEG